MDSKKRMSSCVYYGADITKKWSRTGMAKSTRAFFRRKHLYIPSLNKLYPYQGKKAKKLAGRIMTKNDHHTEFPILYHQGKEGDIYSWDIWTEGDTICIEYGRVDGEKVKTSKRVLGKNLGKKNETKPWEQAVKEAAALHKKKLETKYSLTIQNAKKTVFLPMLAHDWRKTKPKSRPKFPLTVQPKLNGNRCMAYKEGARVLLLSRNGKFLDLPHLAEELHNLLPNDIVFDGEVYKHGLSLQEINHLIKNGGEEAKDLTFEVFDLVILSKPDADSRERRHLLHEVFARRRKKSDYHVHRVENLQVNKDEELALLLERSTKQGYEGVILRVDAGKYEFGFRSRYLYKYKNFMDKEFEVVGFTHGSGADEKTVIWTCSTKEGRTFNVKPMGTREEREKMLKEAQQYVGKKLTVKFQDWTLDKIPQFPVGIAFRLEEDLPIEES